jgi:hypothetical protein
VLSLKGFPDCLRLNAISDKAVSSRLFWKEPFVFCSLERSDWYSDTSYPNISNAMMDQDRVKAVSWWLIVLFKYSRPATTVG